MDHSTAMHRDATPRNQATGGLDNNTLAGVEGLHRKRGGHQWFENERAELFPDLTGGTLWNGSSRLGSW